MIHFFAIFSKNARQTELGLALQRIGVEHDIFSGRVNLTYKHRLKHLLVNMPRLAFFSVKMSFASLTRPITPQYAVLGSDIEILFYSLVRAITRKNTRIVMSSFIFTKRKSSLGNAVRRRYYNLVLDRTALIVVHSSLEIERYSKVFPKEKEKFRFIPWGGHLAQRSELIKIRDRNNNEHFTLVTAGRSGRDYPTLYDAIHDLDVNLKVICDYLKTPTDTASEAKISLLQSCYGIDYLEQIAKADLVVIPLAVEDISAGQMVLIQAMALGKTIIVTDTPTIRDYVTDRHDAWLVRPRDAAAIREAIQTLMSDSALRSMLGRNANETYNHNNTNEALLRKLISELTKGNIE
jgi:glycosyltransferase involved in cell wall biosynthesis